MFCWKVLNFGCTPHPTPHAQRFVGQNQVFSANLNKNSVWHRYCPNAAPLVTNGKSCNQVRQYISAESWNQRTWFSLYSHAVDTVPHGGRLESLRKRNYGQRGLDPNAERFCFRTVKRLQTVMLLCYTAKLLWLKRSLCQCVDTASVSKVIPPFC